MFCILGVLYVLYSRCVVAAASSATAATSCGVLYVLYSRCVVCSVF